MQARTANPDLSDLIPAFEELGISREADLVVKRSWAPAVRKDFIEREAPNENWSGRI
jgi:hypothetical protein